MKIHIDLDIGNGAYQIGKDIPDLDAFVLPRSVLTPELVKKVSEKGRKNFVYFLLDINEARNTQRMIYIGETTDLQTRINGHKKNKLWWNTMVVFSRDILTEYDVKAIERLLIESYEDSAMYKVDNDQGSNKPFDDFHQKYVDYIVSIMGFLAYGITKSVIPEAGDKKGSEEEIPLQQNEISGRRPRFKFSMVGLKPGDIVSLDGNSSMKFKIVDDERVEYKGEPWKLSPLAEQLLTNRKPPLQGPKYFIYEGETLEDRRNRLEGVGKAVTPKTNNWIIACNKTYYDIERALTELKTIDYKQTANIQAGSKIYLYISNPDRAICYECEALVVNKPEPTIDDSAYVLEGGYSPSNRYMEIKLVRKLDPEKLGRAELTEHGLTSTLQSPCRTSVELQKYIDSVIK